MSYQLSFELFHFNACTYAVLNALTMDTKFWSTKSFVVRQVVTVSSMIQEDHSHAHPSHLLCWIDLFVSYLWTRSACLGDMKILWHWTRKKSIKREARDGARSSASPSASRGRGRGGRAEASHRMDLSGAHRLSKGLWKRVPLMETNKEFISWDASWSASVLGQPTCMDWIWECCKGHCIEAKNRSNFKINAIVSLLRLSW